MKLKVLTALVLLSSLVFVGPACNQSLYGTDDKTKIHVGIVFDIGGKDDRSFNAAAWAGVKWAETGMMPDGKTPCGKAKFDIILRDVEPGNPVSIEPAMRAFAGSIETGLPGSTSRRIMSNFALPQGVLPSGIMPVSAHFTPAQAAALKERSSLPPISKTMPT